MKFKVSKSYEAQEGLGAVVAAIFIIPYLVVLVAGSIMALSESIRKWRNGKRSPEEKLVTAIEMLARGTDYFNIPPYFPDKGGISDSESLSKHGYVVAKDPTVKNPKLSVDNAITIDTFMRMFERYKTFVSKIAAISDTENCMQAIDNAFKQSFDVKKDVEFDVNEFKTFNYAKHTVRWPGDPFYKNAYVPVNKFQTALRTLMPLFKTLHGKVTQAIEAKIEGEDKEELQGRVAFIKTCDMIVKMYDNLYETFDNNLEALCYVDVVGVDENGEIVQELGKKYIDAMDNVVV